MPQCATDAPAWSASVIRFVAAGLENTGMYLDDAIGSDGYPIHLVATPATFFEKLCLYKSESRRGQSLIATARVHFLGHIITASGVRRNDDRVLLHPTYLQLAMHSTRRS